MHTNNSIDEVSALVVDPGSYSIRAGYAGEDSPKLAFSSSYGFNGTNNFIGDNSLHLPRENTEILNPLPLAQTLDYVVKTLHVDTPEHPLLLTEPTWNSKAARTEAMQLALEENSFPAVYLVKSPVASLFAAGKGSGLIVDIGHETTSVTPVVDGLVLYKPIRRSRYAGKYLNAEVAKVLGDFEIRRKINIEVTNSYLQLQRSRVYEEFKETMCQLSDTPFSKDMSESIVPRTFEYGRDISREFGIERFTTAEALFRPKEYGQEVFPDEESELPQEESQVISEGVASEATSNEPTPSYMYADYRPIKGYSGSMGLSQMIVDSINACDVDIRANLANNIVITGGTSQVQGLTDRVNSDLTTALAGIKIRLYAPGNFIERNYSSWVGSSILASLGTFHQLWISKKEYEEVGPDRLLERRFR